MILPLLFFPFTAVPTRSLISRGHIWCGEKERRSSEGFRVNNDCRRGRATPHVIGQVMNGQPHSPAVKRRRRKAIGIAVRK
ncbi:hypothetical protein TNIN_475681 [Trichonephila inaurata madagascariensis]|uniref:Uncharacterized protein n=1 Tax=Trichonephila inaurata madagascariensis TaxID=2747483 RepID=A0A8X6YFW6_9ARAC|nr:hypothetical protein TNIN_475681 [Trichonephila inaurata madagascariensis]